MKKYSLIRLYLSILSLAMYWRDKVGSSLLLQCCEVTSRVRLASFRLILQTLESFSAVITFLAVADVANASHVKISSG